MIKLLIGILIAIISTTVLAFDFMYFNDDTGEPIGWEPGATIHYYLDPGVLTKYTNDQLHELLQHAMRQWETIPYANPPQFEFAGYLPEDINAENYQDYVMLGRCYSDSIEDCELETYRDLKTMIIFDDERTLLNDEFCRISSCTARAGAHVFEGDIWAQQQILQGIVVIGAEATHFGVDGLIETMTHELGHLLGLGHPYINAQMVPCLDEPCNTQRFIYIPTMESQRMSSYPIEATSLHPDDHMGMRMLYPADDMDAHTATLTGTITKANGDPMTYANVILREVSDPWCKAYSTFSGINVCRGGFTHLCEEYDMISGDFIFNGIPSGTYTVSVENISGSQYSDSTGIFGPNTTGNAEFWNIDDVADEDPYVFTTITIETGDTISDIDITLSHNEYTDELTQIIPYDIMDHAYNAPSACDNQIDPTIIESVERIREEKGEQPNAPEPSSDTPSDPATTPQNITYPSSSGCSLISY